MTRVWACLGAVCIVLAGACQKDPVVTTRAVTLHAPQSCAPDLPNLDASAFAVYHALGDYEPAAPDDGHMLTVGKPLPEIDPAARSLLVVATEQDRAWQGVSALAPAGPVDVLVLPATTPCALRGPASMAIPVGGAGASIGVAGSQRVLIVGASTGATSGTSDATAAVVLRLDTGEIDALSGGGRTGATVTAFGAGALVAGGASGPSASSAVVLGDAEVYDPVQGDFDHATIALSGPREDAGAVVLATGETLLVGGVGKDGVTPLGSMEIVDPVTRTARLAGATLDFPSRAPTVLRLASGEIFVVGVVDSNGTPVTKLEWFSSDASHATKRSQELVAGSARTYAALQGGGVLAVIEPPMGMAAPMGMPTTFQNTWLIDADGLLEPATPVEGALAQPVLFGGAGGAPVLWTGASASGAPGRWLRWQPWAGAFVALNVLDDTPLRVMGPTTSPDPGMALWLDTTTPGAAKLVALRFDVRGDYSTLTAPLLVSDATDMAPDGLGTDGRYTFDPTVGLTLTPAAGGPGSAFVTDRTYEDVRIEVDAPTGLPALVVLRDALGDEMVVGSGACLGAVVVTKKTTLTVERKGANVTWALSGDASGKGTCPLPLGFDAGARISVGLRSAPDLVRGVASNLRVTRLGPP